MTPVAPPQHSPAHRLAREQRSISIAEFFEKNRHLLGFDSPIRSIITTIKEAVDNALDACEEVEILPDIFIGIHKLPDGLYRIIVEDNGPGILASHIPFVFGKILYGSRFHQIRQSRGQQGIGISAAVLYAQLTSGQPTHIISRCSYHEPAHEFMLGIHTETNEPDIVSHTEREWDRAHGTRIEITLKATFSARKRLIEYLAYSSVVNPHTRITLDLDGEHIVYERTSNEPIKKPESIKPHPHGTELGRLQRMAAQKNLPKQMSVHAFLVDQFSKIGTKTADEICIHAGIDKDQDVTSLDLSALTSLHAALQAIKIPPPNAQTCLSPITEEQIRQGILKEFNPDFAVAKTRTAIVYAGHPVVVEAALGYGGSLEAEGQAKLLRFANRVPLMYQQGACIITGVISAINWRNYGLSQQGLPLGPLLLLVHIASTNVPFTSESKDAVAAVPEIEREITLAVQELGRELKQFLNRRDKMRQSEERAQAICSLIPDIAEKVAETLERPVPDTSPIEGRIMKRLIAKAQMRDGRVYLSVYNYTSTALHVSVYCFSSDDLSASSKKPTYCDESGGEYTAVWNLHLESGEGWNAEYPGTGGTIDIRGISDEQKVVIHS
jgi:DNA topoisomerase-6 subunit B